jgi:hypothetical protein
MIVVRSFFSILLILLLSVSDLCAQQKDSCNLSISLLTCSPGEELYSIFGHSAFRVKDSQRGFDIIFNYGTFDFDDPNFYLKFIRGKLLYFVSTENFDDFKYAYHEEGRGIIEQKLNLTCEQKQQLLDALVVNLRKENRFYLYDFLFDNCSTRLRDMVAKNTGGKVEFGKILPNPQPTFRELIHEYLERGNMHWSKLGIDILLGNKLDRPASDIEAMFLPDYLMKGFDSATIDGKPLVSSRGVILEPNLATQTSLSWFRPIIATILLMLVIGALQFSQKKWAVPFLEVFDRIFFAVLGILGVLILFMWFGTDHKLCRNNFNLLWAIPTHLPIAFVLGKKKEWIRNYFIVMSLWYFAMFFAWALLPQDMNSAIVPIVVLAFMRSVVRFRKIR